jgi:hypothetical protein
MGQISRNSEHFRIPEYPALLEAGISARPDFPPHRNFRLGGSAKDLVGPTGWAVAQQPDSHPHPRALSSLPRRRQPPDLTGATPATPLRGFWPGIVSLTARVISIQAFCPWTPVNFAISFWSLNVLVCQYAWRICIPSGQNVVHYIVESILCADLLPRPSFAVAGAEILAPTPTGNSWGGGGISAPRPHRNFRFGEFCSTNFEQLCPQ